MKPKLASIPTGPEPFCTTGEDLTPRAVLNLPAEHRRDLWPEPGRQIVMSR